MINHQTSRPAPAFSRMAFAALLCGGCMIGFSAIFVRISPVGPIATAFYRMFIPLPLLWSFLLFSEHRKELRENTFRFRGAAFWLALMAPGLFFASDISFWHKSLMLTSVSNANLLGNLAPIFVTLVAWRMFHERISSLFVFGLICALGGTLMLMGGSLRLSSGQFTGDMLAVVSAVLYAGYQLSINRLRRHFSTAMLMGYTSLAAAPPLLLLSLLFREQLLWGGSDIWRGLAALLGVGLGCQLTGQGLIVYAMKKLSASFSSVTLLVQPLVAALSAWLLLGEQLGPIELIGGAVVLTGIVLAQRGSIRANVKPQGT